MTATKALAEPDTQRTVELVGGPLCGLILLYEGSDTITLKDWEDREWTYRLEPSGKTAFIVNP